MISEFVYKHVHAYLCVFIQVSDLGHLLSHMYSACPALKGQLRAFHENLCLFTWIGDC